MKSISNQKGQALIEYIILVTLVAIVSVGVVRVLGHNVNAHFVEIASTLNGTPLAKKTKAVNPNLYQSVRNLGNYMDNANAEAKN